MIFPSGFLPAESSLVSLLPSGELSPEKCLYSPPSDFSRKTLVSWEIQVESILHGREGACLFCLVWLNAEFRKKVSTLQLLSAVGLLSQMVELIG